MDSIIEAEKVSQAQGVINAVLAGHGLGAAIDTGDVLLALGQRFASEPEEAQNNFLQSLAEKPPEQSELEGHDYIQDNIGKYYRGY